MKDIRKKGKEALSQVFKKPKNIDIIERNIYSVIKSNNNDFNIDDYNHAIYQVIGDFLNNESASNILKNIKKGNILWDHSIYENIKYNIKEQDEFIMNPFEVAEGVVQCGKCKSWRTYSYPVQNRSSDEGTSTISQCIKCNNKWTYSG